MCSFPSCFSYFGSLHFHTNFIFRITLLIFTKIPCDIFIGIAFNLFMCLGRSVILILSNPCTWYYVSIFRLEFHQCFVVHSKWILHLLFKWFLSNFLWYWKKSYFNCSHQLFEVESRNTGNFFFIVSYNC